jgi:hypothetical protein
MINLGEGYTGIYCTILKNVWFNLKKNVTNLKKSSENVRYGFSFNGA